MGDDVADGPPEYLDERDKDGTLGWVWVCLLGWLGGWLGWLGGGGVVLWWAVGLQRPGGKVGREGFGGRFLSGLGRVLKGFGGMNACEW